MKLVAGRGYPDDPPAIRFVNKVSMPCVDSKGNVDLKQLYVSKFRWDRNKSLFEALLAIREEMKPTSVAEACRKIPADATY